MINIDLLTDVRDEKLWQIEEMIKTLNSMNDWRDEFLSCIGPASDVLGRADNELTDILSSNEYAGINENYIMLALFLRETNYLYVLEFVDMCKNIICPFSILEGYKMYLEFCFYSTKNQGTSRYKTIEELREKLFERYKYNRNIKDSNKDNIKILKLLTLVDEYEQAINEQERLRTN